MRRPVVVVAMVLLISGGSGASPSDRETQTLRAALKDLQSSRPAPLSAGTVSTVLAYLASADTFEKRDPNHKQRMVKLVERILEAGRRGEDLIAHKRSFFWRGYRSRFASEPQLYSIYIPRNYNEKKQWPLIVSLHGGSSNHNVWMAMLLDNILTPSEYRENFRTPFEANVHEDEAIIVAPQGMGQNHWLGEAQQDVMDVIADVEKHYSIDENKIFLNGLSNGGVASYKIGISNAWRFAAVLPLSGFVDWEAHAAGGASDAVERIVLRNESSLTIAENAFNTNLIFYHGFNDSGFDVSQARRLAARLDALGIPHEYHEIPHLGHHLTHLLWKRMQILGFVRRFTRVRAPSEVRLVTTSERTNRQFWVVLDDRWDHRKLGRIRAEVASDGLITVETENVRRFSLLLNEAPVSGAARIRVDGGKPVLNAPLKRRVLLIDGRRTAGGGWTKWDGRPLDPGLHKRARLSGPIGDAAWEAQIHVYGTGIPEDTPILKAAANLGARGWTRDWEFTQVRHPIIPDTALTSALMQDRVLVLYGNARNNAVLKAIGKRLPIEIGPDYIKLREQQLTDVSTGAKFVCPNPLQPDRYLMVQAGVSAAAVEQGGALPMFLPDYVVYDHRFTSASQKMAFLRQKIVESGFFTETWQLPENSSVRGGVPREL